MTSHPIDGIVVRRRPPEAPPDSMRGALQRRRRPASGEVARRSARLPGLPELWVLPEAAAFAAEQALSNTEGLLLEAAAQGILEDIAGRLALRRSRRLRPRRPRRVGEYGSLYLVFVDQRRLSVQRFCHDLSRSTLELCGFEGRPPSVSEVEARFVELEQDWDVFRACKNELLRSAVEAEPRILDIAFLDPTGFTSPAVLHHACRGACDEPTGFIRNGASAAIEAERWHEVDHPRWGDEGYEPSATRTRMGLVEEVSSPGGRTRQYALHRVQGHEFRTFDLTSGLRRYESNLSWFGGFIYPLGSAFLNGEAMEIEVIPADVQEYDAYPQLIDSVRNATGSLPRVVSADRASSTRAMYEFNTRRRICLKSPERKFPGRQDHADWRTESFDEDGVPRCRVCGGPGNQSLPGLGVVIDHGEPQVRFRCQLRLRPGCTKSQQIGCEEEWLKLTGLSQLLEVSHAVAERHTPNEHIHRHARQRFLIGGKDLSSRLNRPGLDAQRLRAAAALLLLWLRLCLRNGWLTPRCLEVRRNEAFPVRLSAEQDRRSLEVLGEGVGLMRLGRLRAAREKKGLDLPYGLYAASLTGPGVA